MVNIKELELIPSIHGSEERVGIDFNIFGIGWATCVIDSDTVFMCCKL